jgi:adenylosuccinate lyase
MFRLKTDVAFASVDLDATVDIHQFVGRAPQQVDEFLAEHIEPIRKRYPNALGTSGEVRV